MRGRMVCRVLCALMLVLAGCLFVEYKLESGVIFGDDPDPTTGPVALYCTLLAFLMLVVGEVAALRERIEALERDRRA